MTEPMLVIKDGNFIDCNNAALKFLGYATKASFLNKKPSDISPEFQPDGRRSEDKALEILDSAQKEGFQCFNWLHQRADNSEVLVEVMLTPMILDEVYVIHTAWRDLSCRR